MKVGNEILIFIPWNKEVGSQWLGGDGMRAKSGFFVFVFAEERSFIQWGTTVECLWCVVLEMQR